MSETSKQIKEIVDLLIHRTKSRQLTWRVSGDAQASLTMGGSSVVLKKIAGGTISSIPRIQLEILNDAGQTVVLESATMGQPMYTSLINLLENAISAATRKEETLNRLLDDLRSGRLAED